MYFSTQLLTREMGDITIAWTEDQAALMEEVIQKKMDEGYSFFIKDDDQREIRVRKVGDLKDRSVIIGDKDAEMLIKNGKIGIVEVTAAEESQPVPTTKRTSSAKEAARSRTVATRKAAGG